MKKRTEIWTIYGQIEAVVATQMGFTKIELDDIPPSQRFNDFGTRAQFAVIVPNQCLPEFERRIALLRS